jgi:hypothetical protein
MRSFMNCFLLKIQFECSSEGGEVAIEFSLIGEKRDAYRILVGTLKERDHSDNLNVGGRIV